MCTLMSRSRLSLWSSNSALKLSKTASMASRVLRLTASVSDMAVGSSVAVSGTEGIRNKARIETTWAGVVAT